MAMEPTFRGAIQCLVAAVCLPLVMACSIDPMAATDANFEKALNEMLAARSCIELPRNFDLKAPAVPITLPGEAPPILRELTAVGVFTTSPATVTAQLGGQMPGTRFDVTPRGREVIRTRKVSTTLGEAEAAEACIGRFEVTEIISSTEPVDRFGYKLSDVSYRQRWVDYPAWASPLIPEKETDGQVMLAATSQGWVPESSLRRR